MIGTTRLSLAAALATVLAALGLGSVLADNSWTGPTLVGVLLVAGTGIGLRRLRVPSWAVMTAQGMALLTWVGHLVASDVARLGWLPSQAWLERLGETLVLGIDSIRRYEAPVEVNQGILLVVVAGVGLSALAVDAIAVTARAAPFAAVPLATLHVVPLVSAPEQPSAWVFVAAAAGYLLLLAADSQERATHWGRPLGPATADPTARVSRGPRLSSVSWLMATAVLALAVVGAAALPQGSWVAIETGPGGDGGGQVIRTENPIVDLRRDLVRPDNVEVLEYISSSTRPEYLRLTTLSVYDGENWRTEERRVFPDENSVENGLPTPPGLSAEVPQTPTQFELRVSEAYESPWLPLPYPATLVQTSEGAWKYHSSSLDVFATDGGTTAGLRYSVDALEVQPTPDQLRGLPPLPGRNLDMLELPADLPEMVTNLANEVTAGATTSYERAVDLQRWFRYDGEFVYDLAVDSGNSADYLVDFLIERRGYCEQFAASMAIMARVVGIPSRVAVGFLRGEEAQPGLWVVRAQDAHAWPELYFDSVGWIRFEPTPATRTGAAPGYTLRPNEDGAEAIPTPTPRASSPDQDWLNDPDRLDQSSGQGLADSDQPSRLPLVAALLVLVLVALTPLAAGWLTRRRRWVAAGDDPALQAEAAWADISDAALEVGLRHSDRDTLRVAAAGISEGANLPGDTHERLLAVTHAAEQARYAASGPSAEGLRDDAAAVRRVLVDEAPRATRWKALWWPAPMRRLFSRNDR